MSNLPQTDQEAFEAAWPAIHKHGISGGWEAIAWAAWQEAVRLEREAYRELWTAAARVALSNGFDAAYPNNLAALKSMIQSTRGRARSQEGKG